VVWVVGGCRGEVLCEVRGEVQEQVIEVRCECKSCGVDVNSLAQRLGAEEG
jgi:hypothetical protein